ncbi:hypothetical protein HK104_002738, partial [Borealophlyctis nickersoniae]
MSPPRKNILPIIKALSENGIPPQRVGLGMQYLRNPHAAEFVSDLEEALKDKTIKKETLDCFIEAIIIA